MAKIEVQVDQNDPSNLWVTNKDGETMSGSRILFSVMHLLRNPGTPAEGYIVLETTHKDMPMYFLSITDNFEDAITETPFWCKNPAAEGVLTVGQWARVHGCGKIEPLPDGLPTEECIQARATQVEIETEIQERSAQLQQPESDLEMYTRCRVALALQSLNKWNLLEKLRSLSDEKGG
jgi:hypothetical protein